MASVAETVLSSVAKVLDTYREFKHAWDRTRQGSVRVIFLVHDRSPKLAFTLCGASAGTLQ
eukprot:1942567-Amphidinium_carterae.1